MMEAFNEFRPILRELGSARRSPTAGSSDIVRPNPTDKVSDTAPQGPVVAPQSSIIAPGPSSASLEPRASGSGLHSDLRDDKFASPRGDLDKGDQHVGVRYASPLPSPSHQERLREELESVHTQISHIREINDFCRARGRAPPDQSQDDLENLQSKYAQLSLALEVSLYASSSHCLGPSPAFASHQVVSPSDAAPLRPDLSSPHGPRRSARPRSPLYDRSRSRDDYSGHLRHSRRSQERYVERFVPSDAPSHSRRPRSRGPPSPRHLEFTRESPSQNTRCDSLHGGHLRNTRGDSLQEGHPLQSEWASLLTQGLVHPGDPFLGILVLQGHAPQWIPSLQGEVPLLQKGVVMSRETQPLLNGNTHLELRLGRLLKRDPIRDPLRPILLLLREKTEKLMRPLYQHQLRP